MRVAYLGPRGTFSEETLRAAAARLDLALEPVAQPTIFATVMAVHERRAERALVPIENSLEGAVNATLDTLAIEAQDVVIVGETVASVSYCLIARRALELEQITTVVSHPQGNAQCAHFLRSRLPQATVLDASSTADAVRLVAESNQPWAALGTRLSAKLYGGVILLATVEDVSDNVTRFVWLAPADAGDGDDPGARQTGSGIPPAGPGGRDGESTWKTSIVFWGAGTNQPGWLVRCLSELARRDVNLTRIESRPLKRALGEYMFFADLKGRDSDGPVAAGLAALREHAEYVRVLGSYQPI